MNALLILWFVHAIIHVHYNLYLYVFMFDLQIANKSLEDSALCHSIYLELIQGLTNDRN